jgi:predicted DNA-binding ribbon-helix-helix protein
MKMRSEKKKPKRTQVSLRGETYQRIKEEAERRGIRITELVEMILNGSSPLPSGRPE